MAAHPAPRRRPVKRHSSRGASWRPVRPPASSPRATSSAGPMPMFGTRSVPYRHRKRSRGAPGEAGDSEGRIPVALAARRCRRSRQRPKRYSRHLLLFPIYLDYRAYVSSLVPSVKKPKSGATLQPIARSLRSKPGSWRRYGACAARIPMHMVTHRRQPEAGPVGNLVSAARRFREPVRGSVV